MAKGSKEKGKDPTVKPSSKGRRNYIRAKRHGYKQRLRTQPLKGETFEEFTARLRRERELKRNDE